MPDVVTSTLLVLAGVLALLAALAGTLIWANGQPVASIPSTRIRILIGAIGVSLIGAGIWLDYVRSSREVIPERIVDRVEKLEKIVANLQADGKNVREDLGALQSQSRQLVGDIRLLALRTSMTASASDDVSCDDGHRGRHGGRMWIAGPGTACEKTIDAAWSIEIVVPLPASGPALESALTPLGIPVSLDPDLSPGSGRLDEFLAVVFPDETPYDLVCRIRTASLKAAQLELSAAMSASTFRRITGASFPSYTIQVGVPLSVFVTGGSRLTEKNWDTLCDKDATQTGFENFLVSTASKFTKRPVAK